MSQTLCFNDVQFDIIKQNQAPWVRGIQIGYALGYPNPRQSIAKLYDSHADEFTPAMTAVVTLPTEGGPQETRIFSLRGCHLLAMFARTPVAKQFRRWVLDVIEQYGDQVPVTPVENPDKLPSSDAPLTPDQQCTLQAIVRAKVEALPREQRGGLYPKTWSRFNNHFRLAKYCQLPQSRMSEAVAYLTQMDVTEVNQALPSATPALSSAPAFRTDFPADMHTGRKDALRRIQSLMGGVGAARDVVRLFCHPGGKSMSMTLDEREIYDALYQLYCAADDSLLAAYRALDAGYKIGRQYGRG